MEHNADCDALRDAAKYLRGAADKCCQCTDGHHDQRYVYGTEDNVRMSRDTARALADWLDEQAAITPSYGHGGVVIFGPSPHAFAIAQGVLTGSVTTPAAHGFGLLRSASPDDDLTPITGGLDPDTEVVDTRDTTPVDRSKP